MAPTNGNNERAEYAERAERARAQGFQSYAERRRALAEEARGPVADALLGAPEQSAVAEAAYWQGVAVGHANDPERPELHRAVALSLLTPFGPLMGVLRPDVARTIGERLIEHADTCEEPTGLAAATPEEIALLRGR